MDDKLRTVAERIEKSPLPDPLKEEVYQTLVDGLQSTVWPVLIRYIDGEKVAALANTQGEVAFEQFQDLIDEATEDGRATDEIRGSMEAFLAEAEMAMDEQGI